MTTELEAVKRVEEARLDHRGDCALRYARLDTAVRDLIVALSTPPADDVREALRSDVAGEISGIQVGTGYESTTIGIYAALEAADAILAQFEVRPRGTVTDADALAKAWDEGFTLATRNNPNQPHPLAQSNPYRGEARS